MNNLAHHNVHGIDSLTAVFSSKTLVANDENIRKLN